MGRAEGGSVRTFCCVVFKVQRPRRSAGLVARRYRLVACATPSYSEFGLSRNDAVEQVFCWVFWGSTLTASNGMAVGRSRQFSQHFPPSAPCVRASHRQFAGRFAARPAPQRRRPANRRVSASTLPFAFGSRQAVGCASTLRRCRLSSRQSLARKLAKSVHAKVGVDHPPSAPSARGEALGTPSRRRGISVHFHAPTATVAP